jgi:hypothetical protein
MKKYAFLVFLIISCEKQGMCCIATRETSILAINEYEVQKSKIYLSYGCVTNIITTYKHADKYVMIIDKTADSDESNDCPRLINKQLPPEGIIVSESIIIGNDKSKNYYLIISNYKGDISVINKGLVKGLDSIKDIMALRGNVWVN